MKGREEEEEEGTGVRGGRPRESKERSERMGGGRCKNIGRPDCRRGVKNKKG